MKVELPVRRIAFLSASILGALAISVPLANGLPAQVAQKPLLIAQAGGESGNITPEKIRSVVELKLRGQWKPAKGPEGPITVVAFSIFSSGQVKNSPMVRTSAQPEFDSACLDAVQNIGGLPTFPPYLGVSELSFLATFHSGARPWLELKLDEGASAPPGSSSSNQSGWTQPSASAASQMEGPPQPTGSGSIPQEELQAQQAALNAAAGELGLGQPMGQPPVQKPPGGAMGAKPLALGQPVVKPPPHQQQSAQKSQQIAQKPPQQAGQKPPAHGAAGVGGQPGQPDPDLSERVISLNNQAVVAINDNNYEGAIKRLEEALKLDPNYKQARENLAIAYNNYGLQLKNKPEDAIKIFHKAFALDPTNEKTKINLDTIIQYMRKNPKVFKDRLDLGNKAVAQGDFLGARIEWEAALAIKPDPIVQQKLRALLSGEQLPSAVGSQGPPQRAGGATPVPPKKGVVVGGGAHPTPPPKTTGGGSPEGTTDGAGGGAVAQKLDTMYRNLKNLEMKTFGKTFESDDVLSRLSRLEQKLLGKPQAGKPMRRLDVLLMAQ